jgi:HlyD family secretion protein
MLQTEGKQIMNMVKKGSILAIPAALLVTAIIIYGVNRTKPDYELISGTVETRHIDIASKIPGRIDSILIREGDHVTKGMLVAKLESKEIDAKVEQARGAMLAAKAKSELAQNAVRPLEIQAAEKLYLQARAQYDLLSKTYERIQKLYADSVISSQERDQIETQFIAAREQMDAAKAKYELAKEGARVEDKVAAQSVLYQAQNALAEAQAYSQELLLKSPIDGEVEKVISDPGEIIASGYPIITLIDTSDVWIVLQVKENRMGMFKMGSVFTGKIPALDDMSVKMKVTFISPMADFATWRPTNQKGEFDVRTFEIHLRPLDPVPGLRAGMTVNFLL